MPAKKTGDDYRKLACSRGFEWCGDTIATTHTLTLWRCAEGHEWSATYGNIRNGSGCPHCAGNGPKTEQDYRALADLRAIEWLGSFPKTTKDKTNWRCAEGHEWLAPYNYISSGTGCPHCAGNIPKTEQDYHSLASERGFRWVGEFPSGANAPTRWQCHQGHEWETSYGNIGQGTGCPHCAGLAPRDSDDYKSRAKQRGFEWIGPLPKNTKEKSWWRCEVGHEWAAIYNSIQQGRGCPQCEGIFTKTAKDYHTLASEREDGWLGPFPKTTHDNTNWRCSQGHEWEATYKSIRRGTRCPECAGVKRKTPEDYEALAKELGIRWQGPPVESTQEKTLWICEKGHQWSASFKSLSRSINTGNNGCRNCKYDRLAEMRRLKPEAYTAMAERLGWEWLGPDPMTAVKPTWWRCDNGHRVDIAYNSLYRGNGCRVCSGKEKNTSDDYERLAAEAGIDWLGSLPANSHSKAVWRCDKGHVWGMTLNCVARGQRCPHCAGNVPKTADDYQILAEDRGFEWIGSLPPNTKEKTSWRCEKGHEWEAHYNSIACLDSGCPECYRFVFVNGKQTSNLQRVLCERVGGELNRKVDPYWVDITFEVDGVKIAIEYDGWVWHGEDTDDDLQRDAMLIEQGWRVLHVRSGRLLPDEETLDDAIADLVSGESWTEIVLADWGQGPTVVG